MTSFRRKSQTVVGCILAAASVADAQTLSPPHAEYRNKADGLLTLTNDGNVPSVGILGVRGFTLDGDGNPLFVPPAPGINVRFGANSFVIPPHQAHYVFYKASCQRLPCWFAIMNTLTQATNVSSGLRISVVLPHFVYLYQRAKLREGDVRIEARRGSQPGEYRLKFESLSEKLARVETVQPKGFKNNETVGGFPLLPRKTRWLALNVGGPTKNAQFRVRFEDGLRLTVYPAPEAAVQAFLPRQFPER